MGKRKQGLSRTETVASTNQIQGEIHAEINTSFCSALCATRPSLVLACLTCPRPQSKQGNATSARYSVHSRQRHEHDSCEQRRLNGASQAPVKNDENTEGEGGRSRRTPHPPTRPVSRDARFAKAAGPPPVRAQARPDMTPVGVAGEPLASIQSTYIPCSRLDL